MPDLPDLLTLPLDTIAVLAAGYLGYRVAHTGKDASHSAMDTLFMSLVYALVAKMVLQGLTLLPIPHLVAIPVAVIVAVLVATIWRRWGDSWVFNLLRATGVSTSDRTMTAWEAIRLDTRLRPSQLKVRRKDGVELMCERLADFAEAPHGPCIYGADDSIALYVTHQRGPGEAEWEEINPNADPDWGTLITFIPASEIAAIDARHPSVT